MARPTNPRRKAEAQTEPDIEVQESVEVSDETPTIVAAEAPTIVAAEAPTEVAPVVEEIPSPETPAEEVPVEEVPVEEVPEVEEPEEEKPVKEEKPDKEKKDKPNPVPGARRSAVAPQKKIKVLRTGLMLNGRILNKGDEVTAPEALFSQDDATQVASYGDVYFEVTE